MTVATLTLNPALDKSTSIPFLAPEHKLRCTSPTYEPGGGGINVARVLQRYGCAVRAYYCAGGPAGAALGDLLSAEGVPHQPLPSKGWTRENLVVADVASGLQYRFVLPGPALEPAEWAAILAQLPAPEFAPRYLVASGSLPEGMAHTGYAELAARCRAQNIRLVLDTSGPALAAALAEKVFLIKPNLRELAELVGQPELSAADQVAAAQEVVARGAAEVVVVSLGARGALLVSEAGVWQAVPPAVKVRSTVGAGDSMVAGLVWGLEQTGSLVEALRYGVANGTAATLRPGTGLARPADVADLLPAVQLHQLQL